MTSPSGNGDTEQRDIGHGNERRFATIQQWRSAVIRRPLSCGLAGALLALTTLVVSAFAAVTIFWGAAYNPGALGILVVLPIAFGYFYLVTPFFWSLDSRMRRTQPAASSSSQNPGPPTSRPSEPSGLAGPEPPSTPTPPAMEPPQIADIPDPPDRPIRDLLGEVSRSRSRVRQPYRSRLVGSLLVFLGLVLMAGGGITAALFGWYYAILLLLGASTIGLGRQMGQLSALDTLLRDRRQPICYLRSFRQEGATKPYFGIDDVPSQGGPALLNLFYMVLGRSGASMEAELQRYMGRWGPVIAIGKPDEILPTEGASRVYVPNDRWHEVALAAIAQSQLVIWISGPTAGVFWELAAIVRYCEPRRVLLLVPNPWIRPQQFEAFRAQANSFLPKPIAATATDANFISFGEDWTPQWIAIQYHSPLLQTLVSSSVDLEATLWNVDPPWTGGDAPPPRLPSAAWGIALFAVLCGLIGLTYPFDDDSATRFEEYSSKAVAIGDPSGDFSGRLRAAGDLAGAIEDPGGWCSDNRIRVHHARPGWIWCARWRTALRPGISELLSNNHLPIAGLNRIDELNLLDSMGHLAKYRVTQPQLAALRSVELRIEQHLLSGAWLAEYRWNPKLPKDLDFLENTPASLPSVGQSLELDSDVVWPDRLPIAIQDPALRSMANLAGRLTLVVTPTAREYQIEGTLAGSLVYALRVQVHVAPSNGTLPYDLVGDCGTSPPNELDLAEFLKRSNRLAGLLQECVNAAVEARARGGR